MVGEEAPLQDAREDRQRWRGEFRILRSGWFVQRHARSLGEHGESAAERRPPGIRRVALTLQDEPDPRSAVAAGEAAPEAPPVRHGERRVPVRVSAAGTPGDPAAPGAPECLQWVEPSGPPHVGVSEAFEDSAPRRWRLAPGDQRSSTVGVEEA